MIKSQVTAGVNMRLYGKGGRVFRCLWMLEEAGLNYERVLTDWSAGESHVPEFLVLNPNGKVPLLVDGELQLFESLAINYHNRKIAQHDPGLKAWFAGCIEREALARAMSKA